MTEATGPAAEARQPERLQIGSLTVEIDANPGQGGPACGRWILAAGAHLPPQRWTRYDLLLCVFGGQGRLIVGQERTILVPGVSLRLPRDQWWQLQNTGTGAIKLFWVCTPQGIEAYFRGAAEAAAEPDRLATIRADQGIEMGQDLPAETPPASHPGRSGRRRGGRRRGRRRDHATPPQQPRAEQAPAEASPEATGETGDSQPPSENPPAPPPQQAAHRREWRRRRRSRGPSHGHAPEPRAVQGQQQPQTGAAGHAAPAPKREGSRPGHSRRRDGGRRRGPRGSYREVYMDGRWVKVRGEGPVISGA